MKRLEVRKHVEVKRLVVRKVRGGGAKGEEALGPGRAIADGDENLASSLAEDAISEFETIVRKVL